MTEGHFQSTPVTYDYLVSSDLVRDHEGITVYEGENISDALSWALSHPFTTTYVPEGHYYLPYRVTGFSNGSRLVGAGIGNTAFDFKWNRIGRTDAEYGGGKWFFGFQPTDVSNVTLESFTISGDGCICFNTSRANTFNNSVRDVCVENTSNIQITSFGSWVSSGHVADGYRFERCVANHTGGDGFDIWGRGGPADRGTHTNISFVDCKATWCGYDVRYWDWTPGWDIGEDGDVSGVELIRCQASYNWESGFHFEGDNHSVVGARLVDCIANSNGQKYSDPRGPAYGYGCHEHIDPEIVNFSATGNPGGERGWMRLYDYMNESYDYRVGNYLGPVNVVSFLNGTTAFTGRNFTEALKWAVGHGNSTVSIPRSNETGSYTVEPFIITEPIPLAEGTRIYGNKQEGQWPSAFTSITFTKQTDGFMTDSSNRIINIVLSDPLPSHIVNITAKEGVENVTLNWSPPAFSNASAVREYAVHLGTTPESLTALAYCDSTTWVQEGLSKGQTYYFIVKARNDAGWGPDSVIASATPFGTPSAPLDLSANTSDGLVALDWEAPSYLGPGDVHYWLYRDNALLWSGIQRFYNDTKVVNGVNYSYWIAAANDIGLGPISGVVQAYPIMPPKEPFSPSGLRVTPGDGLVALSWDKPSFDGGAPISGYKIYRGNSSAAMVCIATVQSTNYTDAGLANGQMYRYKVSAINSVGESASTSEVAVTPQAPAPPVDVLTVLIAIAFGFLLFVFLSMIIKPKAKN